mmetsp:Transcript_29483/g.73010  ORF Transcript_29483/g.73010 Transcript_29483/m.73010 type:complete len:123 (+) Transcript_29483:1035-1403(+)
MNDEFWRTLFRLARVNLNMSTPLHPQTYASSEAAVKICIDMCRWFVNSNQDDRGDLLSALEFAYNITPNSNGQGHEPGWTLTPEDRERMRPEPENRVRPEDRVSPEDTGAGSDGGEGKGEGG